MTVYEYHHAGNSEAQQKGALAYLLTQSSTGKAATGVLAGLSVAQTTTASKAVLVAAGAAIIQAATIDGASQVVNDSQVTLDILTANPMGAVPRNDLVVLDKATMTVRAIIGTPNAVPTDPAVPASAVKLARVRNAASATTIPSSAIDDLRTYTGLMVGKADIATTGVTAASGWTLQTVNWRIVNGWAHLYTRFTRSGTTVTPPTGGDLANITVGQVTDARLIPPIPVGGAHTLYGPLTATSLWTDGVISLNAASGNIASGDSIGMTFSYAAP